MGTERKNKMLSFTPLLDSSNDKSIYYQLYEYIKKEIISGNIKAKSKLPSLRQLSQHLNLSKNTVEAAYQQLYAEGYIESVPRSSYRVVDVYSILQELTQSPNKSKIQLEDSNDRKNYRFDLSPKHSDKACFNITAWKRISNSILNEDFQSLLSYGDPQGEHELREQIAKYIYENRGVCCHPNQIIVGAGTQYCISLLCQMLRGGYDSIGMEEPGSNWIRFIFERYQFNIEPITVEEHGLNILQLEESKNRIVFVTPSHQFPQGTVMSARNRLELLNWAQNSNGIIIEDDYDSEMKFSGKPIPSLKSMDKNDNVVFLGSFSKIFLPSIRISYMVLPKQLLNLYLEKYKVYEQTASKFNQMVLARFMKEGYLDSHIRKVRRYNQNKYNIITKAVREYMKNNVNLISSSGGLRVILELNTDLTEEEAVNIARNSGINIAPVSQYYMIHDTYKESGKIKVMLSYRGIGLEDIEPAIITLNDAWFNYK